MRKLLRKGAVVHASNPIFTNWMEKARADLALLTTEFPTGPYPCAGIPWFSTPFGRDGIITALQMLWLDPSLARGVLGYLAQHQATTYSAFRDSAPGKIMHETRAGEMASLNEVPFGLYYGGVDSTPLFVMLAGAYADRTGDRAFIDTLWPSLEAAMRWIETDGDSNNDGFVDYARGAETGLANQGWKDSNDSIFHADGSDPIGPIALVEVQGYVYASYMAMATLAGMRDDPAQAERWRDKAAAFREKADEAFWMEDKGTYALAIDGTGRVCAVRASNAGHLLYAGVPSQARAERAIADFLTPAFLNGFGVRTLATGRNPLQPDVLPQRFGVAARYGARRRGHGALRRTRRRGGASWVTSSRRRSSSGCVCPNCSAGFRDGAPATHPWGIPSPACLRLGRRASAFMMLQACLGVTIDHRTGIRIDRPRLPDGVDHLEIRNVDLQGRRATITFQRVGPGVVAYSDQHLGGSVPFAGTQGHAPSQ